MPHVVLLDPAKPERLTDLAALLPSGWTISTSKSRSPEDQLTALNGADYAITADVPVTEDLMAAPGLKAVHKWGVGYDNIDLEAARRNGTRVMRTTGSNAVAVAETALGMMLSIQRNIVRGHAGLLDGKWRKGELAPSSQMLSGKTVGIVGLGFIGKALARLLTGFGCRIVYTKRSRLSEDEEQSLGGLQYMDLDALLATSDVVSLHCELNSRTRNMINADTLSLMMPEAVLINLARGGVVVEADLADALINGTIRAAAVDVFEIEPIEPGNPLLGLDNVILTPHVGAISADAFEKTVTRMFANLKSIEDGLEPPELDVLV